jgi:hypothetical protein
MSGQSFEMRAQGQDAAELIALGLQSIVPLGTNLAYGGVQLWLRVTESVRTPQCEGAQL